MGLSIFVKTLMPRRIALALSCDNRDGLLPCEAKAEFDVTEGIPRDIASRAGWRFHRYGPVYCPACARGRRDDPGV